MRVRVLVDNLCLIDGCLVELLLRLWLRQMELLLLLLLFLLLLLVVVVVLLVVLLLLLEMRRPRWLKLGRATGGRTLGGRQGLQLLQGLQVRVRRLLLDRARARIFQGDILERGHVHVG